LDGDDIVGWVRQEWLLEPTNWKWLALSRQGSRIGYFDSKLRAEEEARDADALGFDRGRNQFLEQLGEDAGEDFTEIIGDQRGQEGGPGVPLPAQCIGLGIYSTPSPILRSAIRRANAEYFLLRDLWVMSNSQEGEE